MKIAIIVPVYNEGAHAVRTVQNILQQTRWPVIIINDGSTPPHTLQLTEEFGQHKRVSLIHHAENKGKGASMRTGIQHAWKSGATAVIFIDGDGQHDPKFLPEFEKKLQQHDLVFGYRLLKQDVPLARKYGNRLINVIAEHVFAIKRKDLLCGFFAMQKKVYPKLVWHSERYGVETELAAKVGRLGLPFAEIQINTTYLNKKHGMSLFDALHILLKIPQWYFFNS